MDSSTLALLYFDVILLDGSRAVAVTSEAGGWKLEIRGWRPEIRCWRMGAESWRLEAGGWRREAGRGEGGMYV